MKTITRQLVSTRHEDYGQVLDELRFEIDDDYEEPVAWKHAIYYCSEPIGMSGSPDFVLPQVLALIAIVFAVLAYVI